MKRFVFLLTTIFMCIGAYAETFNQYWYIENNTPIQTTCETGGDITLPAAPTKYGYDFIGWEKVPYFRIEYLESTGTQYIDTGVVGNQDTRVIFTGKVKELAKANDISNNFTTPFGSEVAYNSKRFSAYILYYFGSSTPYDWAGYGTQQVSTPNTVKVGEIFTIDANKNIWTLSVDNTQRWKMSLSSTTFTTPGNIAICAYSRGDGKSPITNYKGVVYSTKIYDNDILVRDFIPVIDDDGVPCMFDLVEGKFYYNAGTGDFIAGPVIGGE